METTEARPFYLWLSYQTLAADGGWPLPQLATGRNVYWDKDTLRLFNGRSMDADVSHWLPESIPASQPIVASTHRVDLSNGESVLIQPVSQVNQPEIPPNLRLAVVLDRSFSMEEQKQQVSSALADLGQINAQIEVYQTSSVYRAEAPSRVSLSELDTQGIVYFGGQNAAELLAQFAELSDGREYQGVLVITDGSGYELGASPVEIPAIDTPVWLVHLNHDIPLGYDDATLQAIQSSGGGVVGNLDEALRRLAFGLANEQPGLSDLLDGYQWLVLPTEQAAQQAPGASLHPAGDGFAALAARQVILAEMRRQRGTLNDVETLDQLHALAQQYGIVTPYSSMIVLITPQQQNLLDNLSELDDRYEREVEAVAETTPATQTRLTGVPEPEEWLLIGLATAMLAWYALRPRLAMQRR
jgi:putative PEP-CTERM system integral membrane protein